MFRYGSRNVVAVKSDSLQIGARDDPRNLFHYIEGATKYRRGLALRDRAWHHRIDYFELLLNVVFARHVVSYSGHGACRWAMQN